jgi:hypothetical protein
MKALDRKLAAALAAPALLLALAPAAPAASHQPRGEYAPFRECPLTVVTLTDCVYSSSTKGGFTVGARKLPLYSPLVLQGGFEGSSTEIGFHGAENGETLVKVPQPLAGVLGPGAALSWWPKFLQEWVNDGIEKEAHSGISAYIELAAPAEEIKLNTENLLFEEGTVLGLPLKIRLQNQLLGEHCQVGSDAEPLKLKYTSGPSGSLHGAVGHEAFNPTYRMTTFTGARLVDNAFAAPGASGCGGLLSAFLDPLVDEIFELPSAPGQSSAVLEGTLRDAQAEAVRESER